MGEIPESRRRAGELVGRAEAGEQVEVCAGSSVRTEADACIASLPSLMVAVEHIIGMLLISTNCSSIVTDTPSSNRKGFVASRMSSADRK